MSRELVKRRTIFFNSSNRLVGEPLYDLTVNLPSDIFSRDIGNNDTIEIEMTQFSCLQSYYNISASRNASFAYSENGDSNYTEIALTPGNYSVTELRILILNALNTASTLVWTVTLNMNTLKYTFSYTGTPAGDVYFAQWSNLSGLDILGFSGTTLIQAAGTTSDILVSIGNLESIFLHTNLSDETEHVAGLGSLNTLFASIPVYSAPFAPISWEKASDYSPHMSLPLTGPGNTNTLKFSIRDALDRYVIITKNWNMTLKINIFRPHDKSFEKLMALQAMEGSGPWK